MQPTNCKHRKGTICGLCFDCGQPIHSTQLKYSEELRRLISKNESKEEKEHLEEILRIG